MQKITTFLSYVDQAEKAVQLYVSLFGDSRVTGSLPGPGGKPLTISFVMAGQEYVAMNGGDTFRFTEGISLSVDCADQAEVDRYWDGLIANGGQASRCGWLKDPFGVSWQIVPRQLPAALANPDPDKAARAMTAMMKMDKIILADIEAAVRD